MVNTYSAHIPNDSQRDIFLFHERAERAVTPRRGEKIMRTYVPNIKITTQSRARTRDAQTRGVRPSAPSKLPLPLSPIAAFAAALHHRHGPSKSQVQLRLHSPRPQTPSESESESPLLNSLLVVCSLQLAFEVQRLVDVHALVGDSVAQHRAACRSFDRGTRHAQPILGPSGPCARVVVMMCM